MRVESSRNRPTLLIIDATVANLESIRPPEEGTSGDRRPRRPLPPFGTLRVDEDWLPRWRIGADVAPQRRQRAAI